MPAAGSSQTVASNVNLKFTKIYISMLVPYKKLLYYSDPIYRHPLAHSIQDTLYKYLHLPRIVMSIFDARYNITVINAIIFNIKIILLLLSFK